MFDFLSRIYNGRTAPSRQSLSILRGSAMSTIPGLSTVASWWTVVVLLVLINLKALPLAWHVRLFYRMFANWRTLGDVRRTVAQRRETDSTHPLFAPLSIFTHAPLMEIDYNLHKSNSTYFADLDESRTAVMSHVMLHSIKTGNKNLEREGHRGRLVPFLGSVHTSFHREIKPYERYEIRSRVLSWDRKWIIIGSWFIRPATKGKEEVLLASALSKYVMKKGRFTVSPERCFTTAGWLPPKPEGLLAVPHLAVTESSSGTESPVKVEHPLAVDDSSTATPNGIGAVPEPVANVTDTIVQKLESATSRAEPADESAKDGEAEWYRIEKERLRGLRIAERWLSLDQELSEEFKRL